MAVLEVRKNKGQSKRKYMGEEVPWNIRIKTSENIFLHKNSEHQKN